MTSSYKDKKKVFDSLFTYFSLWHIERIEFSKEDSVTMYYQTRGNKDTADVEKLENKPTASKEVLQILSLDSLKANDLIRLKDLVNKLDVSKMRIANSYNANNGKYNKWLDLQYKRSISGLQFYYRIFQEPLDSVNLSSYKTVIGKGNTGGILDDHVIWYFK